MGVVWSCVQQNLDITNLYIKKPLVEPTIFFSPVAVKYMIKNLEKMKPRYSEHILPVPQLFANSRLCKVQIYSGREFTAQDVFLLGTQVSTEIYLSPQEGIPDSGIGKILACRIRDPANFFLWNPESQALEYRIYISRNP